MNSRTSRRFREAFKQLPLDVQRRARAAYALFQRDPYHPSLHFKLVHPGEDLYAVRIGLHYRALGLREGNTITWVWIGSHAKYDRLISS